MDKSSTLEEFRKTVLPRFIEKGVEPPAHDSKTETELYKVWVRGRKKLNQNK